MSTLEIKLGCLVVHLMEHIESQEPMDLLAARGLFSDPEVRDFFKEGMASSLLPLPRQTIAILENL